MCPAAVQARGCGATVPSHCPSLHVPNHPGDDSATFSSALVGWCRLQYFSRVFPATRFSFLDSLKEVLHDVKMYLLFLVLVMLGFATSFHVLYRRDQEKHDVSTACTARFAVCAGLAQPPCSRPTSRIANSAGRKSSCESAVLPCLLCPAGVFQHGQELCHHGRARG